MKQLPFTRPPFFAAAMGIVLLPLAIARVTAGEPEPSRIKRADGFFGLHFDFHARDTDAEIGKNTTRPMIENIIDRVHPDFLQIDCKGHKGFSSYPTKVGNIPPGGIVGDPLKLWRQVTAERGVTLIMHYSGVIDAKAVLDHPDWCVIEPSGKPTGRSTSLFSPYTDSLLIPQLKELALDYKVDGVWIDGDCWGVRPDYSPAALAAFKKATGISDVPKSANDPHWLEFLEFHRDAFRHVLRHYIAEVKKASPGFEIASNWAFSDYMPEAVSAPVDFLSGDLVPADALNTARISGRYLAGQGKPWDLMSWGFSTSKEDKTTRVQRPVADLEREAAIILSLGGGYQIYLKQERDGSIKEDLTGIAEIAKFCRDRQAFCHHAQAVPQVALLLSTPGYYRQNTKPKPFDRESGSFKSPLRTLLIGKYSVELLSEHRLTGKMKDYPLIVVPNWDYIDPRFKEELVTYVNEGGQLLLVGPKPARIFQAELDVTVEADTSTPSPGQPPKPVDPSKDGPLKITLGAKAKAIDIPIKSSNPVVFTAPGASMTQLGKGRIAAVYSSQPVTPLLVGVTQLLFPEPMVEVKGRLIEVVVNRIGGKLAVNLVNVGAAPQEPLEVIIRQPSPPSKVTLQPDNRSLPFKCEDGKMILAVPGPEIYSIVMVE